jgi:pyruvate dehydrogenase E2 component (dihydrolipoamide acetyltransferase)
MATKVILPILGNSMEEGTITRWIKQEGDQISKGEPLLEVMTDKANMEVEAPESGILRKILAKQDETCPVMATIAIIGSADESIDDLITEAQGGEAAAPAAEESAPVAAPVAAAAETPAADGSRVLISPRAKKLAGENGISVEMLAGKGTGPSGRIIEKDVEGFIEAGGKGVSATPLAAKIAADKGVDLGSITGSGPRGKVTRDDVLGVTAAPSVATPAAAPAPGEVKVVPFVGMRKMIADNVSKSAYTAPHVTLVLEVDMTDAMKLRGQIVGQCEQKYGVRVTFTDMIVKAASTALSEYPLVNASLQGNEVKMFSDVNVGIAVGLDEGLVVPVLRNADRKFVPQIAIESKALVEKARKGSLTIDEMSGGTFTITNLGIFGIDSFDPIITPGQSSILGVCRIAEKPVVVDHQVVVRSMMNLCLSFDHRLLDGVPAAKFLNRIKELLESPYQLLI